MGGYAYKLDIPAEVKEACGIDFVEADANSRVYPITTTLRGNYIERRDTFTEFDFRMTYMSFFSSCAGVVLSGLTNTEKLSPFIKWYFSVRDRYPSVTALAGRHQTDIVKRFKEDGWEVIPFENWTYRPRSHDAYILVLKVPPNPSYGQRV